MKKISRLENNKNGEKKNKNKKNRDNELKRKCKQKSMQWLARSIHQDLPMLINVKFQYLSQISSKSFIKKEFDSISMSMQPKKY